MKRTILEIYALAVCFVTVVCAVVALGIGLYDVLQIADPEFTLPAYEYSRHQSNDAFFRSGGGLVPPPRAVEPGAALALPAELSEEEETRRRLASYEMVLEQERRSAKQSLVTVLIVLTIDLTVFLIHWSLARRAREGLAGAA